MEANITTSWIVDSLLQTAHVARTLRAYQITVTALYVLKHHANYAHYCLTCIQSEQEVLNFEQWCNQRGQVCEHPTKHPMRAKNFSDGYFAVQKTNTV